MNTYHHYVVNKQALKMPPAFDQINVLTLNATPENNEFGDAAGKAVNFTYFSLRAATNNPSAKVEYDHQEKHIPVEPYEFCWRW